MIRLFIKKKELSSRIKMKKKYLKLKVQYAIEFLYIFLKIISSGVTFNIKLT